MFKRRQVGYKALGYWEKGADEEPLFLLGYCLISVGLVTYWVCQSSVRIDRGHQIQVSIYSYNIYSLFADC